MNAPSEPEPTTQHDGSPTAGTPDLTKHDAPSGDATTRLPLGPQGRPAGPGAAGPPPGQDAPPPGHGGPPPGPAPQGFPPPGFAPPGPAPQGFAPQGFAPQGFAPPGQSPVPYPGPGYGGPGGPATGPYSPLVGRPLTSDERTWGMLAHLGAIFFGFLAPLVILLVKGPESRFTRDQAVESLNFQITVAIAYVVSAILVLLLIGIVLILVVAVAHLVLSILGALAANKGEAYRYPVAIRLVT